MRHNFFRLFFKGNCAVHALCQRLCLSDLLMATTKTAKRRRKTAATATKLKVSENTHRRTAETEIESMYVIDKTCSCSAYVGPSSVRQVQQVRKLKSQAVCTVRICLSLSAVVATSLDLTCPFSQDSSAFLSPLRTDKLYFPGNEFTFLVCKFNLQVNWKLSRVCGSPIGRVREWKCVNGAVPVCSSGGRSLNKCFPHDWAIKRAIEPPESTTFPRRLMLTNKQWLKVLLSWSLITSCVHVCRRVVVVVLPRKHFSDQQLWTAADQQSI